MPLSSEIDPELRRAKKLRRKSWQAANVTGKPTGDFRPFAAEWSTVRCVGDPPGVSRPRSQCELRDDGWHPKDDLARPEAKGEASGLAPANRSDTTRLSDPPRANTTSHGREL